MTQVQVHFGGNVVGYVSLHDGARLVVHKELREENAITVDMSKLGKSFIWKEVLMEDSIWNTKHARQG